MISDKVELTKIIKTENAENHISWCADQVVKNMSNSDILEFAQETGFRMMISTITRAVTGKNKAGKTMTEKSNRQDTRNARESVSQYIQGVIDGSRTL